MDKKINQFIHRLTLKDVPASIQNHVKRSLIDLIGVGAAAMHHTEAAKIITQHATSMFGCGNNQNKQTHILFSNNIASPVGAALANGIIIDSLDAHDGFKPAKGHIGCGLLPGILAFLQAEDKVNDENLLINMIIGYEMGARAGMALHKSACDYHTSGAWVSLAVAAVGARILSLPMNESLHALGIAEYHGPRSQMMRCINDPTMVKDGSGVGAMAGVSAAYLAQSGFTGAPAVTIMDKNLRDIWDDLGTKWYISEQYFKPYPVCRWAQPAVCATNILMKENNIDKNNIAHITISTFHESLCLATRHPTTTEQAQYSLPFPVAAIIARGKLGPLEVGDDALGDARIHDICDKISVVEKEKYNQLFPNRRLSDVTIEMNNGDIYSSPPTEADGDPESPLKDAEIIEKFISFTNNIIPTADQQKIIAYIEKMGNENCHNNNAKELLNIIFKNICSPLKSKASLVKKASTL